MQITLNESEITKAIYDHMEGMGLYTGNSNIEFTAGRGATGLTATIVVEDNKRTVPKTVSNPNERPVVAEANPVAVQEEVTEVQEAEVQVAEEVQEASAIVERLETGTEGKSLFS